MGSAHHVLRTPPSVPKGVVTLNVATAGSANCLPVAAPLLAQISPPNAAIVTPVPEWHLRPSTRDAITAVDTTDLELGVLSLHGFLCWCTQSVSSWKAPRLHHSLLCHCKDIMQRPSAAHKEKAHSPQAVRLPFPHEQNLSRTLLYPI